MHADTGAATGNVPAHRQRRRLDLRRVARAAPGVAAATTDAQVLRASQYAGIPAAMIAIPASTMSPNFGPKIGLRM